MTTATNSGAAIDDTALGSLGLDGAAESFLAHLEDASKKKPSDEQEGETKPKDAPDEQEQDPEASEETPEDEGESEGSEEAEQKKTKYVDDDEAVVKVKVGDEELEVPVKDLKRLHGQEAALTRKSQEVADQRKAVEADQAKYAASIDVLVKRAEERAGQYRQFNFLALAKDPNISAEELTALQQEAHRAFEEERFLKSELGNFVGAVQQQQRETLAKTAAETVKVLNNPESPLHIEGWSEKTYDDLRTFAINEGVPKDIVNNVVDAPIIKLMHMAMLYKRGASKVATVKVDKTPKKIVKTSSTPRQADSAQPAKAKKAMAALRAKGSVDNAANAFMSRWDTGDED